MNAEEIASALSCGKARCRCQRRHGAGWRVHCPAHDDANPSLGVRDSDGKTLVHCYAGCAQDAVLDALAERGLWGHHDNRAPTRQRKAPPTIRHEIRDASGRPLAVHCRRGSADDKIVWWEQPDGTKGLNGAAVESLPLYGSEKLDSLNASVSLVVTEGEVAADALNKRGVLALATVTGAASMPCNIVLEVLKDYSVILWPDADGPGHHHMERVADALLLLGHQDVRMVHWPDAPPKGDAADFRGRDDGLRALLDAATPCRPRPPLDLATLLDDVQATIRHYVVLTDAQADATTLWAAHTHAFDAAECTEYLNIRSPEKQSGKTRLLETLSLLVARPWLTGRVTAAVLVRKTAKQRPTLLLDESDAAFRGEREYAEALRAVLNMGYRQGGVVSLCLNKGDDFADFPVFGPKAIAGIGKLPETVQDRSIPIDLKRRAPGERVARFRWRQARERADPLREKLERWALGAVEALRDARPVIPDKLDDRAEEGWEPLLAIADMAGADWPERARKAALELSCGDGRDDDSLGVLLLRGIKAAFEEKGVEFIASGELVEALVVIEEAPGGDLRGKPLDASTLAKFLRPYRIRPRKRRVGNDTFRGYDKGDFNDAWRRYVPDKAGTDGTGGTPYLSDVPGVPGVPPNWGIETACNDCGSAGGYADAETGKWWCEDHGPTWTTVRRDGDRR